MSMSVVIVEDEALIALDLEGIVEDAGFTVAGIATDMGEALAIVAKSAVDLAIVDLRLAKGSSGLETARHLRMDHKVPTLFVSGTMNDEIVKQALTLAPVGFVEKPFTPTQIQQPLDAAHYLKRHIHL